MSPHALRPRGRNGVVLIASSCVARGGRTRGTGVPPVGLMGETPMLRDHHMPHAKGIFSYFGYELPLWRRLALLARAGVTHTSLWWGPPEEEFRLGRIHDAPGLARSFGLHVENLHVPFEACNDLWLGPGERDHFARRHMAWIDDARRHGIATVVMHVSHTDAAPNPTPAGLATFDAVARHALEAGVTLAVENTRRDDILHAVLDACPLDSVAFCYDSSHDWLWGQPRWSTLTRWAARLRQTHFSDVDPATARDRHRLPGHGNLDWPALAARFPRDYRGALMLEVMPADLADTPPETFLTKCVRALHWLEEILPGERGT